MDPLVAFGIIAAVIVLLIALVVLRRFKMARDPEYAAKVNKKKAARELERQKRRLERAQMRIRRAKYEEAIAPAKRELLKAKQEHNARIARREDELHRLIKEHDKAIRDQEKLINEIEKKYSQYLDSVGNVKLFRDRLAVRDRVIRMNPTIFAELRLGADILSYGGRYSEFSFEADPEAESISGSGTMIGGIGVPEYPWPVSVDPKFHYLFIYGRAQELGGEHVNICIPLDERAYSGGQSFEAQLNQTAERSETMDRRRARELEEARIRLEEIKADTSGIDGVRAAIERERENKGGVEAAQRNLEAAEARAQKELDYKP